jgi:CubicO group peptidase (beta-lactamase class C family)
MNARNSKLWAIGGAAILIAGIFVGGLGLFGLLPWQGGEIYKDPQGRFTVEVDPNWERVETDGRYAQFKVADPPMNIYLLVLEASTIDDSFSQAFEVVGFDPELLSGGDRAIFGDWEAYSQQDAAGISHALAGQIVGENAYVLVVKADKPGVSPENAAVMRVMNSLKIAGKEEIAVESFADVESLVRKQVDRLAGSVSIAVMHEGQIVYTYAYGEANPVEGIAADTQTIYRFGSMTKPFTASALMQLEERGLVDLDAWPGEYIPEFPKSWNVTVRQLLTHSACMPDSQRLTDGLIVKPGESFAPLEEIFTQYVKDYPELACEPGLVSQYANPHFLALARIIEATSGEPYDTYVVDHILTPLAMDSTHFQLVEADERYGKGQWPADQTDELVAKLNEYRGTGHDDLILGRGETFSTIDDFRVLPPWGGLFGTPGDVTHFLQLHMNEGRFGDVQILQPESVAAMQEMQSSTNGSPLGFGLSWWIGEDDLGTFFYHGGGGHTIETMMRFYPDLDLGVVVMGNVNGYGAEKIAASLVSAWMNEK